MSDVVRGSADVLCHVKQGTCKRCYHSKFDQESLHQTVFGVDAQVSDLHVVISDRKNFIDDMRMWSFLISGSRETLWGQGRWTWIPCT